MSSKKVRQAVIPAAGLGTRFLPATKVIPKELLPVYGRPALEYIIDELVDSGIEEVVLVVHPRKKSILEHFESGGFVETELQAKGKLEQFPQIQKYKDKVRFELAYQEEPKGLGHAVLCAKEKITDDYFAVALPDDLVDADRSCLAQLLQHLEKSNRSVLALEKVPEDKIHKYGIVQPKGAIEGKSLSIDRVVEKPDPKDAPSDLAIMGRYVFSSKIFAHLEQLKPSRLGELQLTDAIETLAHQEGVEGYLFDGTRLDVGTPPGFLEANLFYGLRSPDASKIRELLQKF